MLSAVLQLNSSYRKTPATVSRWFESHNVEGEILLSSRATASSVDRFPLAAAFHPIDSDVEQTTAVRVFVHRPNGGQLQP